MPPPLVSIAIPAYNHAAYVEACLASVCAQTYPELELVMIDDGSTDGTFEIARKFLEPHGNRFRRIVLERQENQGVCATSNAVIAASRGEWVHLLGSDDVLYPNKVARIQQAIDAWQCPDLALVHADIDMIDSSGKVIEGARLRKQRPPPGISREAWHWLFFNRQYIFNPTVALRKDAILSIGGFDPGLALEDLDCWLRLSVSHAIARVPEVLASYRKHPTNSSRKRTKMLAALLHTYGKFVAGHGTLIPEKDVRSHFRTNLKYVWRRIRKVRPLLLPVVATALLSSFLRTPQVQDYQRFGNLMDGLAKQMGDE